MTILRASADVVAKSTVAIVAEQVLEAHGLIEAIGQADSHTQGLGLFAQLLSLLRVLFDGFQEHTLKELKGVGPHEHSGRAAPFPSEAPSPPTAAPTPPAAQLNRNGTKNDKRPAGTEYDKKE